MGNIDKKLKFLNLQIPMLRKMVLIVEIDQCLIGILLSHGLTYMKFVLDTYAIKNIKRAVNERQCFVQKIKNNKR